MSSWHKTNQHSPVYSYICKCSSLGTKTLGASPNCRLVLGWVRARQPKWSQCLILCRVVVPRLASPVFFGRTTGIWGLFGNLQKWTHLCCWSLISGYNPSCFELLLDCWPGWSAGSCYIFPYCISITFLDSVCSMLSLAEHNLLVSCLWIALLWLFLLLRYTVAWRGGTIPWVCFKLGEVPMSDLYQGAFPFLLWRSWYLLAGMVGIPAQILGWTSICIMSLGRGDVLIYIVKYCYQHQLTWALHVFTWIN